MIKSLRMVVVGAALLGSALLGGCSHDPATGQVIIDPTVVTQAQSDVAQAQAIAVKICGYEADFETVSAILASLAGAGPVASVVNMAARGICSAVTSMSARRGASAPTYRGVRITGHFVRR